MMVEGKPGKTVKDQVTVPDVINDIRGEVPTHLNPTLAEKLGTLFIRLTNANRIVIARDMRSTSPALANAFGIRGERITTRAEVIPAIRAARQSKETVLIDFRVEQEDSVYPMVAAGASLHDMIRRPDNPLVETATEP